MKFIWIGILFLAAKISAQEEIKCYECFWDKNGGEFSNPNCIDNLSPALISSCPEPLNGSKSVCTLLKGYEKSTNELIILARECLIVPIDGYKDGCEKITMGDIELEACMCDEDECNDNPVEETTTPKPNELKCYECRWEEVGLGDPDCIDNLSPDLLVTCPESSTGNKGACKVSKMYLKSTQELVVVTRGCTDLSNDQYKGDCEKSSMGSYDFEECICDQDGSNDNRGTCTEDQSSAPLQKMTVIILILSIFISTIL